LKQFISNASQEKRPFLPRCCAFTKLALKATFLALFAVCRSEPTVPKTLNLQRFAADLHEKAAMNSSVKKRSIVVDNHKTSISLEDSFWACLRQIAHERATTASELVGMLDAGRGGGNLSSTIRVFVLNHYRNNVAPDQILPVNGEGRNLPVLDIALAD
jgi:predicted DNA-binding ribbon-helix-helix protein